MAILGGALRLACAVLAVGLAHWAVRTELLPALAAAAGTAAAMGLWAAALLLAAAAPVALSAARGLAMVAGTGLALRGAAQAAPWVTGPALPMEDAAALVVPIAMAVAGASTALWAARLPAHRPARPRPPQPQSERRRASLSSMMGMPSRTG